MVMVTSPINGAKYDDEKVSVKALKDYFGFKDGQKLTDFSAELKELTTDEKLQLSNGIQDGSLNY